jgi:transposase
LGAGGHPAEVLSDSGCRSPPRGQGSQPINGAAVAVLRKIQIQIEGRHRHQEFLRFLNAIERAVPAGKVIHVILDNSGSHQHPKVLRWLARHPRFVFHFTPTAGSWLNAVETFFSALTRRRLKRGSFHSTVDLQAAIHRYIDEHNDDPKPFTWTKTTQQILAKLNPLNASVH